MKRKLLNISILFLLVTCSRTEYEGYTKLNSLIHYKLLAFGESGEKAKPGDFITVDLVYKTIADSIFFKARRKFKITTPKNEGSVDRCFLILSEKDKASFIISADEFFNKTLQTQLPKFLNQGDNLIVEVTMVDIQTEKEFMNEKEAFINWIEDFDEFEQVILKQYIDEEKLDVKPTNTGLYHLKLIEGNGKQVNYGDTVIVDYEGKFLNGKFFDSTKKRREPFTFIYGTQWQVIKGLEEAIGMMTEGEKSIFILPSPLAFGESGSSTGIIPPFTSLIFEVELVSVKKSKKNT